MNHEGLSPGKRFPKANTIRAAVILIYAAVVLPYLRSGVPGSYDRYLVVNFGLLLVIPLLLVLVAFGEHLEDYGLAKGDARAARLLFVMLFTPVIIAYVVAARRPDFQNYYPISALARSSPHELIYWELAYNGLYMFGWEFFFRGFMLFGLRPVMGNWAVLLQALAFGAMHWGKPMPEFYISYLTGIILGIVTLRTRSILLAFALHATTAICFDLLVLAWSGRLSLLMRCF